MNKKRWLLVLSLLAGVCAFVNMLGHGYIQVTITLLAIALILRFQARRIKDSS